MTSLRWKEPAVGELGFLKQTPTMSSLPRVVGTKVTRWTAFCSTQTSTKFNLTNVIGIKGLVWFSSFMICVDNCVVNLPEHRFLRSGLLSHDDVDEKPTKQYAPNSTFFGGDDSRR